MVLLGHLLFFAAGLAAAHPHNNHRRWSSTSGATARRPFLGATAEYRSFADAEKRHVLRAAEGLDFEAIAARTLEETVPGATFRVLDGSYVGINGVAHVHFRQTVDGVDVDNANFNVNILADGSVSSFGNSFTGAAANASALLAKRADLATTTPLDAFRTAVDLLELQVTVAADATVESTSDPHQFVVKGVDGFETDPEVKQVLVSREGGEVMLAWRVEVNTGSDWLVAYLDQTNAHELAGVVDYTAHATYEAYPWGTMNPDEGPRRVLANPEDTAASPLGWHRDQAQSYTTPRGNNARLTVGWQTSPNNVGPSSPSLVFSYPYSPATTNSQSYVEASAAQAFYTVNKLHDIAYALGFNEKAGNFQASNNGKGGKENDPVLLQIQHSDGTSSMTLSADGTSPTLRLTVQSGTTPPRDFVFDATVVTHEYQHGITTRLIGGPDNSNCIGFTIDSVILNEGLSDTLPTLLRVKPTDTRDKDYTVADWTTGTPLGLRNSYITTSTTRLPLTFSSKNLSSTNPLDLVTLWASTMYGIFWNMVETHGIGEVDRVVVGSNGLPQGARYLLLRLIYDSLALMPCSPNSLQARDALVEADRIATGGANRCAIWRGFALRGFGTNAVVGKGSTDNVDGFSVPSGC